MSETGVIWTSRFSQRGSTFWKMGTKNSLDEKLLFVVDDKGEKGDGGGEDVLGHSQ